MSERLYLTDDVTRIRGIGSKKRDQLASVGIHSIEDLLRYYPFRYKDRRNVRAAAGVPADTDVMVSGELIRIQMRTLAGGRSLTECLLRDGSCSFSAVFFNMPFLQKSLSAGIRYIVCGKMKYRNGLRVWTNPEMYPEGSSRDIRGIIPVYHGAGGLTSSNFTKWITAALAGTDLGGDWISSSITEKRHLCSREFAFRHIHFPASEKHYKAARYRNVYETLLLYQLAVRMSRRAVEDTPADSSIPDISLEPFIRGLPFILTDGQLRCIQDIEKDLVSPRPMNRLIQGDVGCGKTVVAEAAIYKCASAGYQCAMMAPTEILARQHYKRLSSDLGAYGLRTVLLISGMRAAERRKVLEDIAGGRADVVVGTHAIIQKDVDFAGLALVITDEQHRFGVNQRKLLARKGRGVNVCVMSATPIPRTMAATVFGDMDFSIIRNKPAERKEIITRVVDSRSRERAYTAAARELEAGHLVYVIAPSIDSTDDDISSVTGLYEEISRRFRQYRTGLLHGRFSKEEKEDIMSDFASGNIRILVATVVVEVGIDVPDATVIIIENSERFGLSQLHQLRGRVGRSDMQSYCYLVNYSNSGTAKARAKAMAEISDGFEISEVDYRLRGPGDIMGTMQSGNHMRDILSLMGYTDIFEAAVEDAELIMKEPAGTDLTYAEEYMDSYAEKDNSNII